MTIVESTSVTGIEPGMARTDQGDVRAEVIVRATEGYTPSLAGEARSLAPIYSLMVATEPLTDDMWSQIGLGGRATFADLRHMVIYGQRTDDGRIAFGGRGARLSVRVACRPRTETTSRTHDEIQQALVDLFPVLRDVAITHRWGGVLGAPRDWFPSVGLDRRSGLAWAGGYVGEGVAAAHLAGRTLADLITGRESELVSFPWVAHRSRRWEPEPLRWLGINGVLSTMKVADRTEARRDRPSRLAEAAWRMIDR